MDLNEFKRKTIKDRIGLHQKFGRIITFVDFGNVNHWFEKDRQTYDSRPLKDSEKFVIDLKKLREFLMLFSIDVRFYYGNDPTNLGSINFIQSAQDIYGKRRVFTKGLQRIKHYLQNQDELETNTRLLHHDHEGNFVYLPKCNFDVEIAVDAIKVMNHYETICLLSSDADFVYLLNFLRQKGKRVILIKGGHVVHQLKSAADLIVNAQDIKKHVASIRKSEDLAFKARSCGS